ncbi:Hypothetical protein ORPV_16 [Orpheovirus IHUMI-LCC2]|uniref:Uncharacterized protein n=1 Tax=Orpheovirus IHUMI-LCC2 TaxID=2023057 RepID=A0A2I2L338_9VIRU|nr:Hypothetical protein ORPV_16 [Orpheovirus IHUMI-LCC2]SNW61920.1 Hypothetical protein ORPV_16 [Orpheovirus IHUMI-LCC2]
MNICIGDEKITFNEREKEIFMRIFGDLEILEEDGELEMSCIRMRDDALSQTIRTIVSIKYPVLSREDFNHNYLINDGDKRNIITILEYFAINVDPITIMSLKVDGCTKNEDKYVKERLNGIMQCDLYNNAILGYIKEKYKYYETRDSDYVKTLINKWKWKSKEEKCKHSIGKSLIIHERKDKIKEGEPCLIVDSTVEYKNKAKKFPRCRLDIKLELEKRNVKSIESGGKDRKVNYIHIKLLNNEFDYDEVGEFIIDGTYTATINNGKNLIITTCDEENRESYRISYNDFCTLCRNNTEEMMLKILREGAY